MNRIKDFRKKNPDYFLTIAIFILIMFGLVAIYSVSKYFSLQITEGENDKYFLVKQLQWVGTGMIIWIVFQAIDYKFWQKNSKYMLFATLFFLVLPIIFGHDNDRSSTRWMSIAGQQFQPSELAKLSLILYLSSWLSTHKLEKSRTLPFFFILGVVSLLMLMQKDFGTLSVMLGVSATMYIVAGASYTNLFIGGSLAAFLFWVAIKLEPYRLQRFTTFLNPENDTLGSGYHIRNALIAIGSGGLFGLGFGQSKQKYLYLPEAHTDSIFAIVCEELGFLRAMLIIAVICFIGVRGFRVAKYSTDLYAALLATGITSWIVWQSFINIGAMLSLLPLTGVPLPFISYGGSSLLVLLASTGILINISKHSNHQKNINNSANS